MFHNDIAESLNGSLPRAGLAPHGADLAMGRRPYQRSDDDSACVAVGAATGELRHERHARTGSDHLAQGLEAGSTKILALMDGDPAAHLQRLIP